MTIDELLHEASDPTTPAERLTELLLLGDEGVTVAVLENPALPLDMLGQALQATSPSLLPEAQGAQRAAWKNPSVPLLLQVRPLPEYREAARALLARLSPYQLPGESLESLVDGWAQGGVDGWPRTPTSEQAHALARRLAALFGLPWSASPGDRSSRRCG